MKKGVISMKEFIGFNIAMIGAKIWEKNGYYIDKENNVVQENYNELPLLGKIGYKLFEIGLKIAKVKPDEIVIEKN